MKFVKACGQPRDILPENRLGACLGDEAHEVEKQAGLSINQTGPSPGGADICARETADKHIYGRKVFARDLAHVTVDFRLWKLLLE
jgi:hypothetical protein